MTGPVGPATRAVALLQLPASAFDEPSLVNPGSPASPFDGAELESAAELPRKGSQLLMDALAELDEAKAGYILADEMYNGECGDLPASDAIAKMIAKAGIAEVEDLNYARVPVDTITDKLGIRAVSVAPHDTALDEDGNEVDDPEGDAAVARAQDKLDAVRDRNQMDIEENELFARSSRYGDAYLEVWPVGTAPDDLDSVYEELGDDQLHAEVDLPPVEVDGGVVADAVTVDIYVNSPLGVRAFYDPERPLVMTHVVRQFEWIDPDDPDARTRQRATIYLPDRIERWVCGQDITDSPGDPKKAEDWKPFLDETGVWPIPYPEGVYRIPFFHHRNGRPYGTPEHKPAYGSQRIINKLISAHAVTIDFQLFPQRYALLDPKGDHALINLVDPDNPEDDDDDPEGDGHSQLRADPAAVWRLYAQAVGQFTPADPQTFLAPLDRYIKSISELCGIPLDRFSGYSTPPSAESRRVGNEVLYEKARNRRRRYGGTLADAYEFALQLMGEPDCTVVIKWEPLDSASGSDDWNIVSAKIANGVPVERALVEAGYDEDEVKQWLLDQGGVDLVRRVALLNQIGTAVQALAAGVSVGLVSQEQAGDIIARTIGLVGEELPATDKPVVLEKPAPPPMPGMGGPPPPGKPGDDKEKKPGGPALPALPPPPPPIKTTVGTDS